MPHFGYRLHFIFMYVSVIVFGSFHGEVKPVPSGRVSTAEALGTISACDELSKLTSKCPDQNKAWLLSTDELVKSLRFVSFMAFGETLVL